LTCLITHDLRAKFVMGYLSEASLTFIAAMV